MEFKLRDRDFYESIEDKILAPYATKSKGANNTRVYPEEEHPYRTAIQRDRDRIIHSRAFRRLKHKQQVFLISESDHYRTRLTHTLEVSQLSRTMAKALGLNELLVEAIALGHDLGHTPFGHIGEVVLNNILSGKDDLDGLLLPRNCGGFKHNYQSLRVLDRIEKKYQFDGLNLTAPVREGILKHTRLLRDRYSYPDFIYDGLNFNIDCSTTLEGQVVAICDEIAQRTHDLEDGIRAGLVKLEQIREVKLIQIIEKQNNLKDIIKKDQYGYRNRIIKALINSLMGDVIESTFKNIKAFYDKKKRLKFFDEDIIKFSEKLDPLQWELNQFIYREIIYKCAGNDITNVNKNTLRNLFRGFILYPDSLPDYIKERIESLAGVKQMDWEKEEVRNNQTFLRIIADHIAGMTDSYANKQFEIFKNENKI